MSGRYGEKTRNAEPVSNLGLRSKQAVQEMFEETFTSPGTWTWPGQVTHVDVLLVGGGGGSGSYWPPAAPAPTVTTCAGGGGGVRWAYGIPVTGPVPVTIGSGGAGGVYPGQGSIGGTSSFGPTSVDGGGGGAGGFPIVSTNSNAPSIGGGGGGVNGPPTAIGLGGSYGVPSTSPVGGGAGIGILGRYGYGDGGYLTSTYPASPFVSQTANTGRGGAPVTPARGPAPGNPGASGIVIVRWWQ